MKLIKRLKKTEGVRVNGQSKDIYNFGHNILNEETQNKQKTNLRNLKKIKKKKQNGPHIKSGCEIMKLLSSRKCSIVLQHNKPLSQSNFFHNKLLLLFN